jgi:hypothetical protein
MSKLIRLTNLIRNYRVFELWEVNRSYYYYRGGSLVLVRVIKENNFQTSNVFDY